MSAKNTLATHGYKQSEYWEKGLKRRTVTRKKREAQKQYEK